MPEQVIGSKIVHRGGYLKLAVLDVETAQGHIVQRDMVQHPGAVAVIALNEDNNVLLIRQFRPGANKILIEIPAGTLEAGEDIESCAVREMQEETGYRPNHMEYLGGWYVAPGYTTEYLHLYLARDLTESRLPADADENIEIFWLPLADALQQIVTGEICNSTALIGLMRVARHLAT